MTFHSILCRLPLLLICFASCARASDRPNILWITSEDNSPYLGCYGDKQAQTPNIDRLASQGIRYRNAFANAPVCSAARSTLITGMYASSLGIQNHRSSVAIPERFKLYPEYLRDAGYYCTNNSKTDYNVADGRNKIWNESSNKAHYKNRKKDQPFFAVFNFTTSHESQVAPKNGKSTFRIPLNEIQLPPYHPDTEAIRRDWANYYDQMTLMDKEVGAILDELKSQGLEEETIVFYYGDHGGALPRGKRNIHDSGTRIPLIIRIPAKWSTASKARPGDWVNDPVSFVDFPATVFSLCGIPIPSQFEGRAFLGEKKASPREHVFLYRGRMDERYDTIRAVRDEEFRYVRNYSPHRTWGQHYSYPFQVQPSMRSWYDEFVAGRCNDLQSAYWKPKPGQEFYSIAKDPFEVDNLIELSTQRLKDPANGESARRFEKLKGLLRTEILTTRDTGFIPEGMYAKLAGDQTIYEYAQSDRYPLQQILDLADAASDGRVENLPLLMESLKDPHPVVRYWGATGCLILKEQSSKAKSLMLERLQDDAIDVRIVAAEALAYMDETGASKKGIASAIAEGNRYETLAALNTLDFLREAGKISIADAQAMVRDLKLSEPADRIPKYLLELK